jgi:hypothetical protein
MESSTITMTNREAERLTVINNLIAGKINGTDAAKQLSLSVRQTKRLKARVKKYGIKGIIHKLRGQEGNNKIDTELFKEVKKNNQERISGFRTDADCRKVDGN